MPNHALIKRMGQGYVLAGYSEIRKLAIGKLHEQNTAIILYLAFNFREDLNEKESII